MPWLLGAVGVFSVLWLLDRLSAVLAPFITAAVVAYILDPLVDRLQARRLSRSAALLLVMLAGCFTVLGLLLMGLNRSFSSAGWVWIKAFIGLLLVKGVITINDPAVRDIAALAVQGGIAGNAEALAELARLARMEWLGGWLALALTIAGIGFGVWRPRFSGPEKPARSKAHAPATPPADEANEAAEAAQVDSAPAR